MIKEIESINQKNIKRFKIYGCYEEAYICCLCGAKAYTDESYSNRGDRLICHTCYYSKFKSVKEARQWINRESKKEAK